MSVKTFAAIDVGSFELTMKIFDFSGKNTMREIDCIRQRIDLGSDTYANGKISNEKMDDLCHTLKEFAQIMEAYKVIAYKAYGTSAIRETENTLILQDQIEQRTGIRVEILSNSEQRFLDYKSIASKGETFRRIIEEKTAILDIGGGSIQLSLFDKDTLVSTQNLRLGVLRLQELLNHLNAGRWSSWWTNWLRHSWMIIKSCILRIVRSKISLSWMIICHPGQCGRHMSGETEMPWWTVRHLTS